MQNWYPGDKDGKGGIYNFVTKRGDCRGRNSKISLDAGRDRLGDHLEVSELHPARRQFARRVLLDRDLERLPAGRQRHQDDPPGEEHLEPDHLEGHRCRPLAEHLSRARLGASQGDGRAQFHELRQPADRRHAAARTPCPTSRRRTRRAHFEHEATTSKISDDQLFYVMSRGLIQEEAVALIVNGFVRDVLQQLPMEFMAETQKLIGISLEGSVG